MNSSRRRRLRFGLVALYLTLLLASHIYRRIGISPIEIPEDCIAIDCGARIVYHEEGPQETNTVPVLLLHGSPGSLQDFRSFGTLLADGRRVIAPSLPGFGLSERRVPDYSTRAHAEYCLQLLDQVKVDRVHLVAFSMGGGVALEFYQLDPRRVESISLVSAIGVQELELLGNYELNHIIHGIQLGFLWALEELTPHFGWLDDSVMSVAYARNFYDTDQRPYRAVLERYEGPMLILHARDDSLVPFAAAREHARIVPQSDTIFFESGNHFLLWTQPQLLAKPLLHFFEKVEAGNATLGPDAIPVRVADAARPFSEIEVDPAHGLSLFILILLIVTGTFITEDLTCIATGLLIASGRLSWEAGFLSCFLGIYLGDQLLYLAGRKLGDAAVRKAPWKWVVSEPELRRAAGWFERRGMMVILLSRFIPGTRLPTYLLAGAVRAKYWLFAAYFFVAVAIWTPLLVGLSILVGDRAARLWERVEQNAFWVLALSFLTVLLILRVILPALTHRGRRRLVGRWRRMTRWEYWPPWAVYPPVVLRILALSLKRGSFARVTAVNPGIHLGGLVGESKWEIYRALHASKDFLARTALLPPELPIEDCLRRAAELLTELEQEYPLVLKPDLGQRGENVHIVRGEAELSSLLRELDPEDTTRLRPRLLLQEYVSGPEFGVFYQRFPGQAHGQLLSLTTKELPELVGDGKRCLEQLILDDPRAVCMADTYMAELAERLFDIPARGERVRLVDLGTHSRGAIFRDGVELITPQFEARIDAIARNFDGFYFGRFDLRAQDAASLREGRNFKILELNGLTGEATHIYDSRYSVWDAWKVLGDQWRDAFAIADLNIANGARPAATLEVLREMMLFLRGGNAELEHRSRASGPQNDSESS